MADSTYRPITDPREIEELLEELPLALERNSFVKYVTGFPHRYLSTTSRPEIVKHYFLMQSLGDKPLISSLSRQASAWKLVVIARDRQRLFSRITGALSCLGADILSAEAFGNQSALVLDTFLFKDREGRFESEKEKEHLHRFLEEAIEGIRDLKPLLAEKLRLHPQPPLSLLDLHFEQVPDLNVTRLSLRASDHLGLLYDVSKSISDAGCNIEMAYIQTVDAEAMDEFYLTCAGHPLGPEEQQRLRGELEKLANVRQPSVQ